jgi:hypothetical protein
VCDFFGFVFYPEVTCPDDGANKSQSGRDAVDDGRESEAVQARE